MSHTRMAILAVLPALLAGVGMPPRPALADTPGTSVDLRLGGGMRIVRVRPAAGGEEAVRRLVAVSARHGGQEGPDVQPLVTYARPPLFGFLPRLAVMLTNKKKRDFDQDMTHVLAQASPPGTDIGSPLNPPAEEHFVIGVLDSGANAHVIAEPYATELGLTWPYLTETPFSTEGVGGSLDGVLSYPIGLFVAGLDAVAPDGRLDVLRTVGHYNVSVIATDELNCGQGESLSALVGDPLLTFYKSIIRISQPRVVEVGGVEYGSPDVQLVSTIPSGTLSQFPRSVPLTYSGQLPPQSCSYGWTLADDGPDLTTPSFPSVLSYMALLEEGGLYLVNVGMVQGEPGPLNPLQTFKFILDTGAQATLITENTAANLGLDLFDPHFTVDVCGVGGLVSGIPGFFIDYVRINSSGPATGLLEYEHAPVIVLNLPAGAGAAIGGLLGMNFFWN
ncbi:MAG: retroviral-like aspartic protease family protein, partial [Phycisphaerae bacterium]